MEHQEILAGFIRLHVLHHAAEGDLYGQWMIEELAHHGYKLSAGTLYPMLHSLEKKGYLTSRKDRCGRTFRRVYNATPLGREALELGREKLRELFREVIAGETPKHRD
ncbi:MAG: helix-turn-helix transcriptional regulator [Sphingopyxis terrae]|nr:helix-turn-helix transcriptional regulator [Sphingopyxis terrae]